MYNTICATLKWQVSGKGYRVPLRHQIPPDRQSLHSGVSFILRDARVVKTQLQVLTKGCHAHISTNLHHLLTVATRQITVLKLLKNRANRNV